MELQILRARIFFQAFSCVYAGRPMHARFLFFIIIFFITLSTVSGPSNERIEFIVLFNDAR